MCLGRCGQLGASAILAIGSYVNYGTTVHTYMYHGGFFIMIRFLAIFAFGAIEMTPPGVFATGSTHICIHFGAWVYPSTPHTLVCAPMGQKAYDRPYVS